MKHSTERREDGFTHINCFTLTTCKGINWTYLGPAYSKLSSLDPKLLEISSNISKASSTVIGCFSRMKSDSTLSQHHFSNWTISIFNHLYIRNLLRNVLYFMLIYLKFSWKTYFVKIQWGINRSPNIEIVIINMSGLKSHTNFMHIWDTWVAE